MKWNKKKKCALKEKKRLLSFFNDWKICFCVQVKPIQFTVQAVVTYSDLQFDLSEVDFGYCPINQSVKSRVHLINLSLLPQDFGFVGVQEVLHEKLWLFVKCSCLDPDLRRNPDTVT